MRKSEISWRREIKRISAFAMDTTESTVIENKEELKYRHEVYDGELEEGKCKFDNEYDKAAYEIYVCGDPLSYTVDDGSEI